MNEIHVEHVQFLRPTGAPAKGTAIAATTMDTAFGALLDRVTIVVPTEGRSTVRVVEGLLLLRDSYARVCAAIGIEP